VIRALSSQERKNILRIVGGYPEGVNYTGILGMPACPQRYIIHETGVSLVVSCQRTLRGKT